MSSSYKNYFKNHFGLKFVPEEIDLHIKFLRPQMSYLKNKLDKDRFSDQKILEIGSGIGSWASLLFSEGAKDYLGMDLDPDVVDFTNKFLGDFFIHQSIEDFDPLKKKYNYVFALEVLEHLENPRDVIKKVHSLLKRGGYLIATTPFPYEKNILSDKTHNLVLHPLTWKKILTEEGFRDVETYPMSFIPYLWRFSRILHQVIPVYIPFKYWVSCTLILARK